MSSTRRELLRLGLGSSTLLACGSTVPTFLARSAQALAADPKRGGDGRILVVVQLDGGNDGLNTVVPHGDDIYRKSRPKLAIDVKDVKRIDDRVGLNPGLDGFSKLLEDGRLAIVQSVGYPNPNRSHFESMAIWNTARLGPGKQTPGWLATAIDAGKPAPGSDAPALHIARGELPQALLGTRQPVPSLASVDQFRRRIGVPDSARPDDQRAALDRIAGLDRDGENPLLPFIERSTLVTYASSARLEEVLKTREADEDSSSSDLSTRLKLIARLIRSGLTTPIYYAQFGNFDTHADQLNQHESLLRDLGRSLRTFLNDLDRSGDGDRVTVLVFSEFGRRLAENASAGTDHGTAAPVFVLGRGVQAGLHGPYPDLTQLDDGDPHHAIDFRQVYATILERWLGLPTAEPLGGPFPPLNLFRPVVTKS